METNTHKFLDILQHIWPYVSGGILAMLAGIKLWWSDRKDTKKRIGNLEVIAENVVTHRDLQMCRDDVRQVDDSNLEKIMDLIRENNKLNAQQHADILHEMIILHGGAPK